MIWHVQGMCVDDRLGACYAAFTFVGRKGRPRLRGRLRGDRAVDVIRVVGPRGALAQGMLLLASSLFVALPRAVLYSRVPM